MTRPDRFFPKFLDKRPICRSIRPRFAQNNENLSGLTFKMRIAEAKQRAAIIVATHRVVVGVRVWDTDEKRYVYHVDNPLIARADFIEWG
jgi:hypothetical protein